MPNKFADIISALGENSEKRTEEQLKEIHRLALCGNAGEIAANIGAVLTHRWYYTSRFREALKTCQDTLAVIADYRTFHNLALCEKQLGEVEKAAAHYQQALDRCPPDDEREKAAIVHNLATLKRQVGEIEAAIALLTESLELLERIGDLQGKAMSLGMLGQLLAIQGDFTTALNYMQDSLAILEHLGSPEAETAREILALAQQLQQQ